MKLLTRNTDYAVRAICAMASKPGRLVTVTELAAGLNMPRPFLRKILQILNKAGVVKSAKGSGGGFSLAKDADRITVADLMEAFQGPLSINECTFKKKACPNMKTCCLRSRIDEIEDQVVNQLRATSVGSLLRKWV